MSMSQSEVNSLLHQAATRLNNTFLNETTSYVQREVGWVASSGAQLFQERTHWLSNQASQGLEAVDPELLPVLKRAVLEARLALANQLDDQRLRTNDPGILQELDKQLLPYDEIMSQEWFLQTKTIRLPQLTDFLTIERAEYHLRNIRQLEDREYDEKFHVLQAPSLLLSDLNYSRVKCAMRNLPLVIAFVDIDDFKSFNIEHGETNVDLYLLPPFMRALEAVVYGRGFAYRLGGDEYAVLIPNTHKSAGAEIIRDFQRGIAQIDYVGVQKRPTVSVGFCEVLADGVLTGRELVIRAEKAKTFAKQGGKNRIATYSDSSCEHLELLPPN